MSKQAEQSHDALTRAQAAEYIADMTGQLVALAKGAGLISLVLLLDMARLEASNLQTAEAVKDLANAA